MLVHRLETLPQEHVPQKVVRHQRRRAPRRRLRRRLHHLQLFLTVVLGEIGRAGVAPVQVTVAFQGSQRAALQVLPWAPMDLRASPDLVRREMKPSDNRRRR